MLGISGRMSEQCARRRLLVYDVRQIQADMVTYTSDRFEEFKEYAVSMIKKGEAYMDDTPQVRKDESCWSSR